jgi:hypothetical protein
VKTLVWLLFGAVLLLTAAACDEASVTAYVYRDTLVVTDTLVLTDTVFLPDTVLLPGDTVWCQRRGKSPHRWCP